MDICHQVCGFVWFRGHSLNLVPVCRRSLLPGAGGENGLYHPGQLAAEVP